MKAAVIIAPSRLEMQELPSRPLQNFEARIRVVCASICGSDWKNINTPVLIPQTPGHEFSGMVVEITPASSEYVSIGDRVTAYPMITCLVCEACKNGNHRDCSNKESLGFQLPGAFAEEIIVDSRFLIHLNNNLSYEQGALVEHLCCGYRLVKELEAKFSPEDKKSIVIIGDGPIAMADIKFLVLRGYSNITLIGKHQARKELAYKLGATQVIDFQELLNGKYHLENIDVCIYAANAEATLENVSASINPGGIVFPQTRINEHILKKMLYRGIAEGRAFTYLISDFYTVMDLIDDGLINVDDLVSSTIALSDFVDGVCVSIKKDSNKIMIVNEEILIDQG